MGKLSVRITAYVILILCVLAWNVTSRHLHYDDSDELVSDGVNDGHAAQEKESFLHFRGMISEEHNCEEMYGFLPCSTSLPGHIFLIVIYEYLLYHAESYAGGDGRLFRLFGNNFCVSVFYQLLDALPDSLILLATGLSTSKEKAQEYVVTGAGLLAGSSILLLTLLWGVCFICSRTDFFVNYNPRVENQGILFKVKRQAIHLFTGSGVLTDAETKYHAKVMFYSLIPFVVILLPSVFGLSYSSQEYEIVLLVSLLVSVICLFSYFFYQYSNRRIQNRRLEYAEVEQKVKLHVPFFEVEALMLDSEKHFMIKEREMKKTLIGDPRKSKNELTMEKFYDMFKKWLDGTRKIMDDPHSCDRSGKEYNQVLELLLENKKKLIDLISPVIKYVKDKGAPDGDTEESVINRFFDLIDTNKDNSITNNELRNFIKEVNDKELLVDDGIVQIMMRYLDIDGDGNIDRSEFITGVSKLLDSQKRNLQNQSLDINQVSDGDSRAGANAMERFQAIVLFFGGEYKAIILLLVGIFMLMALAEPLVESVRQLSESVKLEPFYVSFILVPLATNARTAVAAIRAAKQSSHQTISVTFSEIYHKVFMNNILGFSVLVSVIYFRGLTWHFSAEILVVIMVCIIMGLLASFRTKFPNWILLIAFPLYPLSLVVVYIVNDAFQFT